MTPETRKIIEAHLKNLKAERTEASKLQFDAVGAAEVLGRHVEELDNRIKHLEADLNGTVEAV